MPLRSLTTRRDAYCKELHKAIDKILESAAIEEVSLESMRETQEQAAAPAADAAKDAPEEKDEAQKPE